MRRIVLLLIILAAILTSCQKFDPILDENTDGNLQTDNPNTGNLITSMSDLVISNDFDWSLIKTLDVQITLPEDDKDRLLYIFSQDGKRLYYKGHPEDGTNILQTKVTVPTYESVLFVKYGGGSNYPEVGTYLSGNNLDLNIASSFKSAYKTGGGDNIDDCDTDSDYDVTTFGGFKFEFDGVEYLSNGKSKWTYTVTGIAPAGSGSAYKDLSHWNIALCEGTHGFVSATDGGVESYDSNNLDFYGIKWDYEINKETGEEQFSFTLNDHYTIEPITVGFKAANNLHYCQINGPSCTPGTNPPDPEDPCEDDGDYDTADFGWFSFEYLGMTEDNNNGTSTWSYKVSGNAPEDDDFYKDLSHWALALCYEEHVVTAASPDSDWEVGMDANNLNFYGIKWDKEIDKLTGEMTFSFTLDDQYDVEPVTVGFKAGNNLYYCEIYGPSCTPNPDPPDPTPEVFGTIAFEDLWPGKGDYDINDLVIEYDFVVNKDNNDYVQSIDVTFEIRAFGAGLHNGFGFQFPNVDPSDIISVTGYDIQNTSSYVLDANGTEAGQSKATFILYDDAYRMMEHPGSGIGVNTDPPAPYVTPAVLNMSIDFVDGQVSYSQLDIGNFNPFIVKDQNRDIEVHLPNYPPTDLADQSHFGTFDDDSADPKFYLTEDNLPWGILIPERYDYPVEKQIILGAHLHFAEWAQSDGVQFPDWYKDEPGYRNVSVIYQIP